MESGRQLQGPGPGHDAPGAGSGAALPAAQGTRSWPGWSSAGPDGGRVVCQVRAGLASPHRSVPTRQSMGPAHPHQDQRLLVDEVLLLDCQLPRVHAGKQGLWLWLRLRLWRHHNGCEYGRQSGWTSAMAELPALCPLCPLGPRQHPPSSSPYLRRDTVAVVQPYLAWRGPPPLLASWARVQASWLAGIRASASSLSTLREQGPPPRSVPAWAHRQPPFSPRQREEYGPPGC